MRFRATVELHGKSATGVRVPDDVVSALGTSRRPAVQVTIGGHTYPSTIAFMGGRFLLPISAENRSAAGVAAGESIDVDVQLDSAPREVAVPPDLRAALDADAAAGRRFDALSYSHKREWVLPIEQAKTAETRARRIAKTVATLGVAGGSAGA